MSIFATSCNLITELQARLLTVQPRYPIFIMMSYKVAAWVRHAVPLKIRNSIF